MNFLEALNLHKVYRDKKVETRALNGVSLKLKKGEFICIEGPSGSGKTTLLNLIGGLDSPTEGEVFIVENNIHRLSENELAEFRLNNIGFIFQTYNLIEVLSAKENVEFPLLLSGVGKKQREARALKMLEMVGLEEFLFRRPIELSGGQQQRVAIARALVTSPKLVLADEPTANLDSKTGGNIMKLMAEMNERLKITFVFSSHDPRVISSAKRIIILRDGRIEEDKNSG